MSPTAAARSPGPKTAVKTGKPSPRSGHALPVGAHPGNTGGKKGRSGRKPLEFKQMCRALASSRDVETTAKAILADAEHPQWAGTFKAVAAYGYGVPKQHVKVDGKMAVVGVIAMPIVTAPAPPSSPMETAQRVFRPVARGAKLQALADQLPEPAL